MAIKFDPHNIPIADSDLAKAVKKRLQRTPIPTVAVLLCFTQAQLAQLGGFNAKRAETVNEELKQCYNVELRSPSEPLATRLTQFFRHPVHTPIAILAATCGLSKRELTKLQRRVRLLGELGSSPVLLEHNFFLSTPKALRVVKFLDELNILQSQEVRVTLPKLKKRQLLSTEVKPPEPPQPKTLPRGRKRRRKGNATGS